MKRSTDQQPGKRRYIRWTLSIAGLLILFFFIRSVDFPELIASSSGLNPYFVVQALVWTAVNVHAKALRWRALVRRATQAQLSYRNALSAVVAGVAGASLLPGRAFDVAKPLMLRLSHGVPAGQTIPIVLYERVLDLGALVIVFLGAVATAPRFISSLGRVPLVCGAGFVLSLLLVLVALRSRWLPGLWRFVDSRSSNTRLRGLLNCLREASVSVQGAAGCGWAVLHSLIAMLAEIGRAFAVFRAFGLMLPINVVALTFTASILVGLLALIPGGVGVTETSQAAMISLFVPGIPAGPLRGAILFDRFLSYYLLMILGALILFAVSRLSGAQEGHG